MQKCLKHLYTLERNCEIPCIIYAWRENDFDLFLKLIAINTKLG